jgi:hypothetical protein
MTEKIIAFEEEEIKGENDTSDAQFMADLEELRKRCEAATIEFLTQTMENEETYGRLLLASGREKRPIVVGAKGAKALLSTRFEDYVFVQGYEAICSYSNGTIEAGIRGLEGFFSRTMMMRLFQERVSEGSGSTPEVIEIEPPIATGNQPKLRIGPPSKEFRALNRYPGGPRGLTLTLSGITITNNDGAAQLLVRYANSLFFQIDLSFNVAFTLERERRRRALSKTRRPATAATSIQYPRSEYDAAAISLYWYARSARGMPLLQFLAFYQVIEFYYPRYSHLEAKKKLSAILKDPTFRVDRGDHVDRLISAIRLSRSGAIGDERSQLRAVVNECIGENDIRSFITFEADRETHFSEKSKKQRYHKIPVQNKSLDLRNDVADRIYDIRCKIVHTKDNAGDGDVDMILPFTTEADYLLHDIDLVQFVAKSVLIVASAILS